MHSEVGRTVKRNAHRRNHTKGQDVGIASVNAVSNGPDISVSFEYP